MSNQQYRGAQIPDHRADWLNARPPAPVWTENLSCPSSGDARTLLCYAGAGPRYVYRKAKGGEFSMSKGMRWETLTGAAYVDQDTVNIGGSNVTATGNATYLGLACNYITWPAATHNWASSYCGDDHGVAVALGQLVTARLEFAVSRPLVGDETLALNCVAGAASSRTFTAADDIMPGQFYATIINEYVAAATNTPIAIYYNVTGTFATPLTIYMRRRMLFDASGLAASECVPDFVDPAVDYGFGAVGVKWLDTTCGNTVDANGVIIPGTGAAMPEPMGVAWQPAATGLATNSPPTAGAEITVTAAPAAVAGLPAKRITSSVVNTTHVVSIVLSNITGTRSLYAVLKKPTSGDAVPLLNCYNSSWSANIYVLPDWSASAIRDSGSGNIVNHRLTSLGNNDYLLEMVVSQSGQLGQAAELLVVKSESVLSYAGAGEYLDIAAFNVVDQAFSGTPLLASGSQTARIADDPATGLPAIGTGPFTAFVDVTVDALPAEIYPKLFSSNGSSNVGVDLYFLPTGAVWFYKDGSTPVSGTCSLSADTRAKLVLRRSASGVVSLFKDGALEVSIASTAHNSTNSPAFGSGLTGEQCDMVIHDTWLEYSALSDEDCIRVTRL